MALHVPDEVRALGAGTLSRVPVYCTVSIVPIVPIVALSERRAYAYVHVHTRAHVHTRTSPPARSTGSRALLGTPSVPLVVEAALSLRTVMDDGSLRGALRGAMLRVLAWSFALLTLLAVAGASRC